MLDTLRSYSACAWVRPALCGLLVLFVLGGLILASSPLAMETQANPPEPVEIVSLRTMISKTFDNGDGTYTWKGSLGPIHYRDATGQWQDIVTDLVATGDAYENLTNVMGVRIHASGAWRVHPERSTTYFQVVPPFAVGGLSVQNNRATASFAGGLLEYIVEPGRLKVQLVLAEEPAVKTFTWPLVLSGLTLDTSDPEAWVVLRDGRPVGELWRPRVTRAGQVDLGTEYRSLDWAYDGQHITVTLDDTGLDYPLIIDPTYDAQTAATADDAWNNTAAGGVSDIHGHYALPGKGLNGYSNCAGQRFTNVAIPQGVAVNSAVLKVHSSDDSNFLTPALYLKIVAQDVDNATAFDETDANECSGKTPDTTAAVDWDLTTGWAAHTWYDSPDVKTVVQEVTDRAGWSSGNSLIIKLIDDGTATGNRRHVEQYDHDSTVGPNLVIIYSAWSDDYLEPSSDYGHWTYIGASGVYQMLNDGGTANDSNFIAINAAGRDKVALDFTDSSQVQDKDFKLIVTIRAKRTNNGGAAAKLKFAYFYNGSEYGVTECTPDTTYSEACTVTWDNNPNTGVDWTLSEVNGFRLIVYPSAGGSGDTIYISRIRVNAQYQ